MYQKLSSGLCCVFLVSAVYRRSVEDVFRSYIYIKIGISLYKSTSLSYCSFFPQGNSEISAYITFHKCVLYSTRKTLPAKQAVMKKSIIYVLNIYSITSVAKVIWQWLIKNKQQQKQTNEL